MNKSERIYRIRKSLYGTAILLVVGSMGLVSEEVIQFAIDPDMTRSVTKAGIAMGAYFTGMGVAQIADRGEGSAVIRDIEAAMRPGEGLAIRKTLRKITKPFVAGILALTSIHGIPVHAANGTDIGVPLQAAFIDHTNKRNDQTLYEYDPASQDGLNQDNLNQPGEMSQYGTASFG